MMDRDTGLFIFGLMLLLGATLTFAKDPLDLGMEKTSESYGMACNWDRKHVRQCQGKQAALQEKMQSKFYFKRKPDRREPYFQEQSKPILKKLPDAYQKCGKYLDNVKASPPADESKLLNDKGQNYPFKAYAHCLLSVLRAESKGIMTKDPDAVWYGMDKVREAYDKSCAWDTPSAYRCRGQQKFMEDQIRSQVDDDEKATFYFAQWMHHPLNQLHPSYKEKCGKYLSQEQANAPAPVDESKDLNDNRKYYPFRAYAHCLMSVLRKQSGGKMHKSTEHIAYGIEKTIMAYEKACQHEADQWKCDGQQKFMGKQITTREEFKGDLPKQEMYYGKWTKSSILPQLSWTYYEKCEKYLDQSEADPPYNESEFLKDTEKPNYPYKAYAHCLIHTLRQKHGGKLP